MNAETFISLTSFKLSRLISVRKEAYEGASSLRVVLFQDKYWDLLASYKGQEHYITTLKK